MRRSNGSDPDSAKMAAGKGVVQVYTARYTPSPRAYPAPLPALEYPLHFMVKRVTDAGTFRFQKRLLYLANSLVDQHIGLEETDDWVWSIYFNTVLLAVLDERDYIIRG